MSRYRCYILMLRGLTGVQVAMLGMTQAGMSVQMLVCISRDTCIYHHQVQGMCRNLTRYQRTSRCNSCTMAMSLGELSLYGRLVHVMHCSVDMRAYSMATYFQQRDYAGGCYRGVGVKHSCPCHNLQHCKHKEQYCYQWSRINLYTALVFARQGRKRALSVAVWHAERMCGHGCCRQSGWNSSSTWIQLTRYSGKASLSCWLQGGIRAIIY